MGRLLVAIFGLLLFVHSALAQEGASGTTQLELDFDEDSERTGVRDGFGSQSVGHLVTANNKVLNADEVSLGVLYAAYGLTDNWMVGTSPFVYFGYEMNNFMTRYAVDISGRERLGFDFAYFKTFGEDRPGSSNVPFEMEAWNTKLTYNNRLLPYYRLNLMGSYYYYINDENPFSLRMDPANNDRYALVVSSLHEIRLSRNVYFNLEGGIWGLNYRYTYYHVGGTLNLQNDHFLLGIGASATFSPTFPVEEANYFAGYDSRGALHPELQIQAFF